MGEFLRRYVSRRLPPLSEGDILNKKGSRHCPGIEVQSKETLMAPCSAAWLRGNIAARQSAGRREPFLGLASTIRQITRSDYRNWQTSLRSPEKLTVPHDLRHALQKNGGLADLRHMDDGDIMCHPIRVLPFLCCRTPTVHCGPTLGQGRSHPCNARARPALPRSADRTEFALFRESLVGSRVNHIPRAHGHTILQEQRAAEIYDEDVQRSLERLFPGLTEDSTIQATLSACGSGIGFKRARDIAALAHLGASSQPNRASWV